MATSSLYIHIHIQIHMYIFLLIMWYVFLLCIAYDHIPSSTWMRRSMNVSSNECHEINTPLKVCRWSFLGICGSCADGTCFGNFKTPKGTAAYIWRNCFPEKLCCIGSLYIIVHHLFSTTRFLHTFERPTAAIFSNSTGFLLHLRLRLLRPSWGSRDRRFPASKHISKEFPSTQIILHHHHLHYTRVCHNHLKQP